LWHKNYRREWYKGHVQRVDQRSLKQSHGV
jgi:hypothetical protein